MNLNPDQLGCFSAGVIFGFATTLAWISICKAASRTPPSPTSETISDKLYQILSERKSSSPGRLIKSDTHKTEPGQLPHPGNSEHPACPSCGRDLVVKTEHAGVVVYCSFGNCHSIITNNGAVGATLEEAVAELNRVFEEKTTF